MQAKTTAKHLQALLSGEVTVQQLQELGTPEALDAVSISARNFNSITMDARDILSAMNSRWQGKVKKSPAVFELMLNYGLSKEQIMHFLGKTSVWQIDWKWTEPNMAMIRPFNQRAMMDYSIEHGVSLCGLALPVTALVQDCNARKAQKLYLWIRERAGRLN